VQRAAAVTDRQAVHRHTWLWALAPAAVMTCGLAVVLWQLQFVPPAIRPPRPGPHIVWNPPTEPEFSPDKRPAKGPEQKDPRVHRHTFVVRVERRDHHERRSRPLPSIRRRWRSTPVGPAIRPHLYIASVGDGEFAATPLRLTDESGVSTPAPVYTPQQDAEVSRNFVMRSIAEDAGADGGCHYVMGIIPMNSSDANVWLGAPESRGNEVL
jgi:hypothetical protein